MWNVFDWSASNFYLEFDCNALVLFLIQMNTLVAYIFALFPVHMRLVLWEDDYILHYYWQFGKQNKKAHSSPGVPLRTFSSGREPKLNAGWWSSDTFSGLYAPGAKHFKSKEYLFRFSMTRCLWTKQPKQNMYLASDSVYLYCICHQMKMLVEILICIFPVRIDLALVNHSEFFLPDESRNCMQADGRDLPFRVNMLQELQDVI